MMHISQYLLSESVRTSKNRKLGSYINERTSADELERILIDNGFDEIRNVDADWMLRNPGTEDCFVKYTSKASDMVEFHIFVKNLRTAYVVISIPGEDLMVGKITGIHSSTTVTGTEELEKAILGR